MVEMPPTYSLRYGLTAAVLAIALIGLLVLTGQRQFEGFQDTGATDTIGSTNPTAPTVKITGIKLKLDPTTLNDVPFTAIVDAASNQEVWDAAGTRSYIFRLKTPIDSAMTLDAMKSSEEQIKTQNTTQYGDPYAMVYILDTGAELPAPPASSTTSTSSTNMSTTTSV